MQRWKKHLWTGSLLTLSILLILAAVAMGAVRLLDLVAPKYREDLAASISESIELPVTIGGIGMRWQNFRPSFELDEVVILDDERRPVFQVGHIGLPFKWSRLFRGELFPYLIELNGLAVSLEWRADGSIGIKGIQTPDNAGEMDLTEVLGYLEKINRIQLVDGVVHWEDLGAQIGLTRIEQVNADVRRIDDGLKLQLEGRLPRHLGDRFHLSALLEGELSKPAELEISNHFRTEALYPDGWLAPMLRDTVALRGGPLKVEFRSEWQGLNFRNADLRIAVNAMQDVGAGDPVNLPGLQTELKIKPLGDGWEMDIVSLQYLYAEGGGPVSQGHFRYQPTPDGFGTRLDASLNTVQAGDVLAWLSVLETTRDQLLPAASAVNGRLLDTRFEYYQAPGAEPQYSLSSAVEGLTMPATDDLPGVRGFSGKLYATHEAGRFEVNTDKGELDLPLVFAEPLPLEHLQAVMHWEREGEEWRFFSEDLSLKVLTAKAQGSLSLKLDGQDSPYIDLQLGFSAGDIVPLKPFIPLPPALPESVGEWLRDSLDGAKVPKGDFVLRGRLSNFPFENPGEVGLFRIAFEVRDASLSYAEGWPRVSGIHGQAVFKGRSMHIDADRGEIIGVPVSAATASIPDFLNPVLQVRGQVQADVGRQLSFLANSPLRPDYQGLLDAIRIEGPGQLDLKLDIPLENVEAAQISGDILLQGITLKYSGMDIPVTDIRGLVNFSDRGLASEALQGRFLGLPTTARLTPMPSAGSQLTQLNAVTRVTLPQDMERLAAFVPADSLKVFEGQTDVKLASRFDTSATASDFQISGDLVGMKVQLGEPFGKSAEASKLFNVNIHPGTGRLDISWDYAERLQGQLRYRETPAGYQLAAGRLHLGPLTDLAWPEVAGFFIDGQLPVLDLNGFPLSATSGQEGAAPPIFVDARVDKLKVAHQVFEKLTLQSGAEKIQPVSSQQGYLRVTSDQMRGRLRWQPGLDARLVIHGEFDDLALTPPPEKKPEDQARETPPAAPIDPAKLPLLNLQVEKFRMGNETLGSLKLNTQAISSGLRLSVLEIGGRRIEVRGGGEWVRLQGSSSARLVMNINGGDIIGLLNATGYAQSITAKQADIFMELDWSPDPAGLELDNLNGKMSFDLVNGSLLEVKPGAGRVLSLLSFYSLPRRLSLDFSDVVGKGTAYDKLTGEFAIVEGNATTENLEVTLPSARIEVRGRVGLAAQDYDQTVTIYPGITSGVALAGALIGGPIMGIGLWIAQELLQQPLDQVAQLSYRLTGSWDDPKVKPLGAKPVAANKKKPAADAPPDAKDAAPNTAPKVKEKTPLRPRGSKAPSTGRSGSTSTGGGENATTE